MAVAAAVVGLAVALTAVLLSSASIASKSIVATGTLLSAAGIALLLYRGRSHTTINDDPDTDSRAASPQEIEEWREEIQQALTEQGRQVEQRHRELDQRMLRFREFLEYPQDTSEDIASLTELSEKDREVNRLLEAEAARVYEKIRADGYRVNGRLDTAAVRDEVFDVIVRVARVYSPESENPLLETSFDQLARAASRVCLQALVLVEQLPIDVQHYTLAELYAYIRRAVGAWGTWQTVSPWLTQLSRGVYAGRLAASSNPVSLGAWWLASELGRRGTKKLVDQYVDQRAVAFLNGAVRLIGNEVACVYGPGIRQRDPAWALGAELTELLHHFPPSRQSLQAGLRTITTLPLRSEYDRIYLYRCLAEQKSSGFRLADPTVLTRDEREAVAHQLEEFFDGNIHGATDETTEAWKDSVEEILDLKLSLKGDPSPIQPTSNPQEAIHAIHSFLTGAAGLPAEDALNLVRTTDLFLQQHGSEQQKLAEQMAASDSVPFTPPDTDPADALTTEFLTDLVRSVCRGRLSEDSIESLLLETGRYFRRSDQDMRHLIAETWQNELQARTEYDAPVSGRHNVPARRVLELLSKGETLVGLYTGLKLHPETSDSARDLWLAVVRSSGARRLLLFPATGALSVIWVATNNYTTERVGGFLIDDCAISGGDWQTGSPAERIVLSGKFGTGYPSWFAPLLPETPEA